MKRLTAKQLARMIDLSSVRAECDLDEIRRLAEACKQYQCICAFVMPCYIPEVVRLLADQPSVGVGGVVGFPSGATSTRTKVAEVREQVEQGVDELDMVINVGLLRSGCDECVEADIRAVIEAAGSVPVKVILEAHYLTDEQIVRGSQLSVAAGAALVKTATGWAETGATPHNVALIKATIGDAAGVKAAGGVRDLESIAQLMTLGATRFGVSLSTGVKLLEQCPG